MNKFSIDVKDIPKGKVNCMNIHGRTLVSIDISKANYQAAKYVDIITAEDGSTWEELMSKYTDSKYLMDSKKVREIVFGNCAPKRFTTVERYLNFQVLNFLLENIIPKSKVVAFFDDEIIIEYNSADSEYFSKLVESIKKATGVDVNIEAYTLQHVYKDFCIKHFINKPGYLITGVPLKRFFQALNYVEKCPTVDYDLIFWDDDAPAKYLSNVYVEAKHMNS